MVERWFSRLAELTGINYAARAEVDRSTLEWADLEPVFYRDALVWQYADGEFSSRSPAKWLAGSTPIKKPTPEVLDHIAKVVELPGTAPDYHFSVQAVLTELWSRRRHEPDVFAEVERLGWESVHLIEAAPDAVQRTGPASSEYGRFLKVIDRMCSNALRYVQLQEALGRPPEPKEIGAEKWGDSAKGPDWERYQQVIARSLSDLGVTTLS